MRPLDPVRSIKAKLGILIAVTVALAAVTPTLAWMVGVRARYAIPIAVLVALALTQLLARGMTSPLREMTAAAKRMARGSYGTRVTATSNDEVGELARAFNAMAADLEAVDRQRRELVANVSHELRTPVTALQAVLENLADGVAPASPETLEAAVAQTRRLSQLVGDLLDLSRVDAGISPLRRDPVDVAALLGDAVREAELASRPVAYDVTTEPGLTITGDRARLHQLVANLLDNAGRHAPAQSTVRVQAHREGDSVRLEVSDEGPGIAPADRTAVFERFATGGADGGGTGLGLAIARWVTDLHGGSIRVADEPGCRVVATFPDSPPPRPLPQEAAPRTPLTRGIPMTTTAPPPSPSHDLLATAWPADELPGRPRLVAGAAGVGVLAALVLPERNLGIGTFLVLGALIAAVAVADPRRRQRIPAYALCVALAFVTVLRDAEWIAVLCLLAGAVVATTTLVPVRSFVGFVAAGLAVPVAWVRGLPWLRRSLAGSRGSLLGWAVVRTVLVTVLLTVVFGALFASADEVFAGWIEAIVPDLTVDSFLQRAFVAAFVAAGTLAFVYLALHPPVSPLPHRRPAGRTFEWLLPVAVVDLLFVGFLAAQASALFGGHDHVQKTTGLTYAEYVHRGFAEMTVATVLTLLVVGWAARRARRDSPQDKVQLRVALGLLCLLALVVVGSALHRMHAYNEAYGDTQLRLLATVFEGWLGLVLVLVLVAGIGLRAPWLPRTVVLTGAVTLLGLALLNPDAYVARQNLDSYEQTGKLDVRYLTELSHDADGVIGELPAELQACLDRDDRDDDWLEWNLGRARGEGAGLKGLGACPDSVLEEMAG